MNTEAQNVIQVVALMAEDARTKCSVTRREPQLLLSSLVELWYHALASHIAVNFPHCVFMVTKPHVNR